MLKVLRDNLKYLSWILWVVILIFIAFVFVDFGGGLTQGTGARASAATVGTDKISYADFERQYRQLEAQYRQAFGENFTPGSRCRPSTGWSISACCSTKPPSAASRRPIPRCARRFSRFPA